VGGKGSVGKGSPLASLWAITKKKKGKKKKKKMNTVTWKEQGTKKSEVPVLGAICRCPLS